MKIFIVYITLFLSLFLINTILGQGIYSRCPNYQIDIKKTGTGETQTDGGLKYNSDCNLVTSYYIGKQEDTRTRGIYQWDISNIPHTSTINNITISFSVNSNFQATRYFDVSIDITNPELNLDDLYDATHYTIGGIGVATPAQITFGTVSTTFTGASDPFIIAFVNSLSNGWFTMGAAWNYDGPSAGNVQYLIGPQSYCLTVDYTPPTNLVTVDQRNSINQQVGTLKKWEGG